MIEIHTIKPQILWTIKVHIYFLDQSSLGRRKGVPGKQEDNPEHVAARGLQRVPAKSVGMERYAALFT